MLSFYPLYWIYHDCWKWTESTLTRDGVNVQTNYHAGHIHLFMMDYNPYKHATQQAYTGTQIYNFTIEDVWGPNSSNETQITSYKLVGKPRWYFKIKEYWRRVYIQPWDIEDHARKMPCHPDRIGIKWDASKECHTLGPFREGRGLYFFQPKLNRTLPVEYWLNEEKTKREHLLRKNHFIRKSGGEFYSWDETPGGEIWVFEDSKNVWYRHSKGWWWMGDNVKYDDDGNEIGGYNYGDIYSYKNEETQTQTDRTIFYRNTFIPSNPLTSDEDDGNPKNYYYPNPTPGASKETLRMEYLMYFGFNWRDTGNHGYDYGKKYVVEYLGWKSQKIPIDSDDSLTEEEKEALFQEFISEKSEEFIDNCFGGSPGGWNDTIANWNYTKPSSYSKMIYEYVSWEDFQTIWEELSLEECQKLGLYGSYPVLRNKESSNTTNTSTENSNAVNEETTNPYDSTYHNKKTQAAESPYEVYKKVYSHRDVYTIPRDSVCKGDYPQKADAKFPDFRKTFSDEDGARRVYSDNLFQGPVIEYQEVWQLGEGTENGERLPGAAAADQGADIWNDEPGTFGEGFSVSIEIPYRINGIVQSPFSDDSRIVYPPGTYFHNRVKEENKLKYAYEIYGDEIEESVLEDYYNQLIEWKESDFNEKEPAPPSPLDKVKKYRRSEFYAEIMDSSPTLSGLVEWYNTNYAGRPIIQKKEEGEFDINSRWIPEATQDRPSNEQVEHENDNDELPIIKSSSGGDIRKNVTWNKNSYPEDGIWVEQCLGAKVEARVELIMEDAMGHRWAEWVTVTQAESATGFVGKS